MRQMTNRIMAQNSCLAAGATKVTAQGGFPGPR